MSKKYGWSGRQMYNTQFANSGRIAGSGVLYDDYGEDSYKGYSYERYEYEVRFPNDGKRPEELNGEPVVICYGKESKNGKT